MPSPSDAEAMRLALAEAELALASGDVPVGDSVTRPVRATSPCSSPTVIAQT